MDCRTFRNRHLAFVDDTLPGVQVVEMQRHLLECERCARLDTRVRRSLLVVRNLAPIEPSDEFQARLAARLDRERARMRAGDVIAHPLGVRGPNAWTFLAVAASLVGVGYLASATLDWTEPRRDIALAPVVATRPETPPVFTPPLSDPALVASFSAGIPIWPVAYFAGQAPVTLAAQMGR